MRVPILAYHSWLSDGESYAENNHLALATDLEVVARLGLSLVPLEQVVDAMLARRLHELEGRVGISFDDASLLDVEDTVTSSGVASPSFLAILRRCGRDRFAHATSFVIGSGRQATDPEKPEPRAAEERVRQAWLTAERSGYIKVENHGWSHSRRVPADLESAMHEITRTSDLIDSVLGQGYCRLYAYPNGRSNEYQVKEFFPHHMALHRLKAAFAADPEPLTPSADRWCLPRFVCGRDWNSAAELGNLLRDARKRIRVVATKPESRAPAGDLYSSYSDIWEFRARTEQAAMAAVDGSGSETALAATGGFVANQIRVALNLKKSDKVLELGCGIGRIGRELAPHCLQWTGSDISKGMIATARRRTQHLKNVEFLLLQRSALTGLANNRFDKAYSVAVFCHIDKEDMFIYLQELCRVLKPGGWLYFETWNLAHPVGWKRWSYEVRHWARSPQTGRKDVSRNQFSVPEEVRLLTGQAGFEIVACYNDSAWVQMVALKPGDTESVGQALAWQASQRVRVAFNEQFTECFSRQLDVVYGASPPEEFLVWLNEQDNSTVVCMYREYLFALWQSNRARWGAPPPSMEK